MQHLRLTHPALDFWIEVRLREFDGRWLAVAELPDTPVVGTGETAAETLRGALAPFGGEPGGGARRARGTGDPSTMIEIASGGWCGRRRWRPGSTHPGVVR